MRLFFILLLIVNFNLVADDELFDDFEDEFKIETTDKSDFFYTYNKTMTKYNDLFYTKVFFPIATNYAKVVPKEVRLSVSNFFSNLKFPIRLINNTAQLKFKNSLEESERFIINSTIGLGGLFDVAYSEFNLTKHNEDFGQTLGFYGVGAGEHIVLPFIGPSNIRDSFSMLVDSQFDPIYYLNNEKTYITKSVYYINEASFKKKEYESLKQDAIELYPYLKNIYEQHRESEIKE